MPNPFQGFGTVAGNVNMLAGTLQGQIAAQEDRRREAQQNFENEYQLANAAQVQANWMLHRGDALQQQASDEAWRSKVFANQNEQWALNRGDTLADRSIDQAWREKVFGSGEAWKQKEYEQGRMGLGIGMAEKGYDPTPFMSDLPGATGGILGSLFGNPYAALAKEAAARTAAFNAIRYAGKGARPATPTQNLKNLDAQTELDARLATALQSGDAEAVREAMAAGGRTTDTGTTTRGIFSSLFRLPAAAVGTAAAVLSNPQNYGRHLPSNIGKVLNFLNPWAPTPEYSPEIMSILNQRDGAKIEDILRNRHEYTDAPAGAALPFIVTSRSRN